MAEKDDDIIVRVVLDDKEVDKALGSVQKKADAVSSKTFKLKFFNFDEIADQGKSSLADLTGNMSRFGIAAAAVGAVLFSLKKALDFASAGEDIKAVHAQFDMLAKSAGLVPERLEAGLEKAADRMIGMEGLLRSANSALINMGDSAKRLPEILELSRKVTAVMGGDIEERFAGIVSAIESGNARALKAQGIIIDADKAMRDYARSLGLTTGELNQNQRQQAILNATLAEGEKKFKDVQVSVQPIKDTVSVIKTNMGDVVDNIKKAISESETFKGVLDGIRYYTTVMAKGVGAANAENIKFQIDDLVRERKAIEKKLAEVGSGTDQFWNFGNLQRRLSMVNSQLEQLGVKTEDTSNIILLKNDAVKKSEKELAEATVGRLDATQQAALRVRELALEQARLQAEMVKNSAAQAATSRIPGEADRRAEQVQLLNQREILLEQEKNLKLLELRQQYAAGAIQTEMDLQARIQEIKNQFAQQESALQLDRQNALMEFTATAQEGMSGYDAAFAGLQETLGGAETAAKDFAVDAASNFRNVGKQMFNSIGTGAAQAFAAFGQAVATGENALQAFVNSLLSAMGQMAIQLGTQFILQGAAYTWAGMPNGPALMAAGAALAAFGGLLVGFGGGQSSSSGGGIANSSDSETTKTVEPEKLERKEPDTHVNVTIQGDVFDSQETGRRIVDIVNSEFQKSGVKISYS